MGAWLYPEGRSSARRSGSRGVAGAILAVALTLLAASSVRAAGPKLEAKWQKAGGSELTLSITLERGWHVNANDPDRPYLIPTTLEVTPPAGSTVESIRYPDAVVHSLAFAAGTPLRLYEGTFAIRVKMRSPLPPRFDAQLAFQACNDETCLPPATLAVPYEGAP